MALLESRWSFLLHHKHHYEKRWGLSLRSFIILVIASPNQGLFIFLEQCLERSSGFLSATTAALKALSEVETVTYIFKTYFLKNGKQAMLNETLPISTGEWNLILFYSAKIGPCPFNHSNSPRGGTWDSRLLFRIIMMGKYLNHPLIATVTAAALFLWWQHFCVFLCLFFTPSHVLMIIFHPIQKEEETVSLISLFSMEAPLRQSQKERGGILSQPLSVEQSIKRNTMSSSLLREEEQSAGRTARKAPIPEPRNCCPLPHTTVRSRSGWAFKSQL